MNFDNIYQLLLWFFRKAWLNPPKMPGNHDLNKIRWTKTANGLEEVWETAQKIRDVMSTLSPKDAELIRLLFTEKTTDDIAVERNLTERRVRQIRLRIIEVLQLKCQEIGLLGGEVPVSAPVMVRQ